MGRAYLMIIVVGVLIGALLPSDFAAPGSPARGGADAATGRPTHIIDASTARTDPDPGSAFAASAEPGRGTTLDRAADGHFYADAKVNGVTVHFLVDTGASGVALSAADARRVGLPFFSSQFTVVGRGASGDVRGKMVTLDRVSLGSKSVDNVGGAILEGSEMSLLGQSFLGQMGTIEITPDKMVIR